MSQERIRWRGLRETTRISIVEMNKEAMKKWPGTKTGWRHFTPIDLTGILHIYGDAHFNHEYLRPMIAKLKETFKHLVITEPRSIGQGLYGFDIDFRQETNDDVYNYMACLPDVVVQDIAKPSNILI